MLICSILSSWDGRIVDGTGNAWYGATSALERDDRYYRRPQVGERRQTIHADKLISLSGFIDIHSHGDLTFFGNPGAISKAVQGVTTEVVGNCGMSCAQSRARPSTRRDDMWSGCRYRRSPIGGGGTMGEYMQRLEQVGMGVDQASPVGHGTLRSAVMGFEDRAPSDKKLRRDEGDGCRGGIGRGGRDELWRADLRPWSLIPRRRPS